LDLPVEILIGGGSYRKIMKDSRPIRISESLVLIPSIFVWILSGSRSGAGVKSTTVNIILSDRPYVPPYDELRRFWDLETFGITAWTDRSMSAKDSALLGGFRAFFSIQGKRRVVSLPKKQGVILPKNRMNTERRLSHLRERLDNNKALKRIYYSQMVDYIAKAKVQEAPPSVLPTVSGGE
jgi:hypothetical protein